MGNVESFFISDLSENAKENISVIDDIEVDGFDFDPEINSNPISPSSPKQEVIKTNTINGVNYFFDSFGISPEQTVSALNFFKDRVILISGSDSDYISFDLLGDALVKKAKHLILIGQTSGLIELSLLKRLSGKNIGIDIRITHCSTLKQAVDCAYLSTKSGDNVLLSPAGDKFESFASFEELKNAFDKYVSTES